MPTQVFPSSSDMVHNYEAVFSGFSFWIDPEPSLLYQRYCDAISINPKYLIGDFLVNFIVFNDISAVRSQNKITKCHSFFLMRLSSLTRVYRRVSGVLFTFQFLQPSARHWRSSAEKIQSPAVHKGVENMPNTELYSLLESFPELWIIIGHYFYYLTLKIRGFMGIA